MQKPPKKHPRTKIKRKFLILKDGIMMNWTANWIAPPKNYGHVCPVYRRKLTAEKPLKKAQLFITAAGTFKLTLDGEAFGNEVLAPGWTSYDSRLQYREYDLTNELSDRSAHELCVTVGEGWFRSNIFPWRGEISTERYKKPAAIIAELHLTFADGEIEVIPFGKETEVAPSALQYCDNFNGAVYNAALEESYRFEPVVFSDEYTKDILIPSEGVPVREQERFSPRAVFETPKGETVVDFGQNIAGYVEFRLTANKGDRVKFSHGEVLDKDGNFYNANYRGAKALVEYTCKDGAQTFKPNLTFFGFRYIRLDEFPGAPTAENFTAIAVYSDMERTGFLTTAHPQLTQLFSNILWSQRDNFVDIPTDCPQRDERRGWTGDAQVFIRTACYNYNVKEFFKKWLNDLKCDQRVNGSVPSEIPDPNESRDDPNCTASAVWGDAACVCPWELYKAYGDKEILENQFHSMCRWVDYITNSTTTKNLWTGGTHFCDWLGLDAPAGSYVGSSDKDLIASAFYYYSTGLVIKAGEVLGRDVSDYRALHSEIYTAFLKTYNDFKTQTECVLAIHFDLCEDPKAVGKKLTALIHEAGDHLTTGFVGTPYLLHALHEIGETKLAYDLLLTDSYPSWLFSVKMGATTIWEHWDGINEKGEMWSTDMNSFNHYAYGSVADWVYGVAAGIQPLEENPGYEKVKICPNPDKRLGTLTATLKTAHGVIRSGWSYSGNSCRYEITVPVEAEIVIDGKSHRVKKGSYIFYSEN